MPRAELAEREPSERTCWTRSNCARPRGESGRVVHLAGRTNARESFTDPVGYYATNVTGTVNLLTALRRTSPSVLVFASTHAVYGSQRDGTLCEADPVQPESPYAASKVSAEQLLAFDARTGQIGAVVLRCFNVAGGVDGITDPDRTRLIPRIIEAALPANRSRER